MATIVIIHGATGVADRAAQATKAVIYLDAMVPRDGQSVQAFFPELVDALISAAKERGDGRAPLAAELEPPGGPVNDEQRAYLARVRPHPIKCFTEAARISGAVETLPRAYIRCVGAPGDVAETGMRAFADRAQAEGWPYREIETPHDLQLFDPDGTAALIDELVKGFR
jgi:hypothetical protein